MELHQPYNERDILLKVAAGDKSAFEALFEAQKDRIYTLSLQILKSSELAEDAVQDIFLKLWLQRSNLSSVDNFGAYLNTVTRNHLYNIYKKQALESTYALLLKADFEGNTDALFADPAIYAELKRLLGEAMQKLSPQQRRVYILGKQDGMKYDEIATALNISKETVKDHMSAALNTIREHMRVHGYSLSFLVFVAKHWIS
ncbi:RNA polymerase sigma factor [Chitinophaga caeni]|uniref:RNA polymerase sigma factor n=1 Tax=Chitinophaga caeni TaxID=2029983 RepID=UPI0012FD1353|nr:RNA polymerase sigma-70 factor [Chitinophaga caeni]